MYIFSLESNRLHEYMLSYVARIWRENWILLGNRCSGELTRNLPTPSSLNFSFRTKPHHSSCSSICTFFPLSQRRNLSCSEHGVFDFTNLKIIKYIFMFGFRQSSISGYHLVLGFYSPQLLLSKYANLSFSFVFPTAEFYLKGIYFCRAIILLNALPCSLTFNPFRCSVIWTKVPHLFTI